MKPFTLIILICSFYVVNSGILETEDKIDRIFSDYQGDRSGAAVLVIIQGKPVIKNAMDWNI
jgi:hypothetical protein